MYAGLIMESGATQDIITNPMHPYTKALLAGSPAFGSHYSQEKLLTIPGKVPDPVRPEPGCPFSPRCVQAQNKCSLAIPDFINCVNNREKREYRCIKDD